MKKLFIITFYHCLFILEGFAITLDHVKPVLRFDESYLRHEEIDHRHYLEVAVEQVFFPTGGQREKFELALLLLEQVLNSDEFKRKVLSYKNGHGKREYQKNYLWDQQDSKLSNEDVYRILMKANEKMIPESLGQMNIYARVRQCGRFQRMFLIWCHRVIGSTDPRKSPWMTLNWRFYKVYEVHNMVANIVHEWIHLLGFLHGKENMNEEVPYVVGAIAGQVAKSILLKNDK